MLASFVLLHEDIMRNWPEHLMTASVFLFLASLILMYYGQANSARIARCDDPEFVKVVENVQWCAKVRPAGTLSN